MKKMISCMLVLFVVIAALVVLNGSGAGIVAVDGYAHGVALCQNSVDAPRTTFGEGLFGGKEDGIMWVKDGIFYVINVGHYDDPEVKELEALAKGICAQYR